MNIYDIAKEAGVSIATVSRIINNKGNVSPKTQDKVLKVMQDMGYTPNAFARALGLNSIKMVGVLCSDVADKHYAKAVSIIEKELRSNGYDAILCCTGKDLKDKKKAINVLLSKRVDAMILVGSVFQEKDDNSHIKEAAETIPVMIINGTYDYENTYSVSCDEEESVYTCVKKLVEDNHKEILYIYDVESLSGINKKNGYLRGLTESNIPINEQLIVKCDRTLDSVKDAVDRVIENDIQFSAIIAAEDVLAVGAMKSLTKKRIRVPRQVVVVGFNNSVLAECSTPALTSIDNKIEILCESAVKTLLDVFDGKKTKKHQIIKGNIVYRESFVPNKM
ncbi:MAG: LacI family DNA-binding transcriptional regulator [Clostridiales bacterium]|nr:LacI family DNA-binding transcriptional regulator [Clostridiales bacterium]